MVLKLILVKHAKGMMIIHIVICPRSIVETAHKDKNLLPMGANSFLEELSPF